MNTYVNINIHTVLDVDIVFDITMEIVKSSNRNIDMHIAYMMYSLSCRLCAPFKGSVLVVLQSPQIVTFGRAASGTPSGSLINYPPPSSEM